MNSFGSLAALNDRNRIIYSDQNRLPTYSVQRYITYLRNYVSETTSKNSTRRNSGKTDKKKNGRKEELVNPLSYFLRKLKLDLKMSYTDFVSEFVRPPSNGLQLLLALLKNTHSQSDKSVGTLPRSRSNGALKIDDYKQHMVDELDCLLCIKYTMRISAAVKDIIENSTGLLTIAFCCISHYSKSRIAALEILTLLITGPSAVDRVLDAFTTIRLQYSECTRFKMLISMLYTRGVDNILYQINTLRLLNSLLNTCKSPNMRVYLQYEMEEAGIDLDHLQLTTQRHGLEYDDLNKQIQEWKTRYIDVNYLLKKLKFEMKGYPQSHSVSDYLFDQQYGDRSGPCLTASNTSLFSSSQDVQNRVAMNGRQKNGQETLQEVVFYKGKDKYFSSFEDVSMQRDLTGSVNERLFSYKLKTQQQQQQLPQREPEQQWQQQHQQKHHYHQQQYRSNGNIPGRAQEKSVIFSKQDCNPTFKSISLTSLHKPGLNIANNIIRTSPNRSQINVAISSTSVRTTVDNENETGAFEYDDNWMFKKPNSNNPENSDHVDSDLHIDEKQRVMIVYDSNNFNNQPVNDNNSYDNKPLRNPDSQLFWTREFGSQHLFYTGPPTEENEDKKDPTSSDNTPQSLSNHPAYFYSTDQLQNPKKQDGEVNIHVKSKTDASGLEQSPKVFEHIGIDHYKTETNLPCDIQEYNPKPLSQRINSEDGDRGDNKMNHTFASISNRPSQKQKDVGSSLTNTTTTTSGFNILVQKQNRNAPEMTSTTNDKKLAKAKQSQTTFDDIIKSKNQKVAYDDDEVNTALMELDRALEVHGCGKDSIKSGNVKTKKTFMAYI